MRAKGVENLRPLLSVYDPSGFVTKVGIVETLTTNQSGGAATWVSLLERRAEEGDGRVI